MNCFHRVSSFFKQWCLDPLVDCYPFTPVTCHILHYPTLSYPTLWCPPCHSITTTIISWNKSLELQFLKSIIHFIPLGIWLLHHLCEHTRTDGVLPTRAVRSLSMGRTHDAPIVHIGARGSQWKRDKGSEERWAELSCYRAVIAVHCPV